MAGFGGFTFTAEEAPLPGRDSGWVRRPDIDQAAILGSSVDSVVALSARSAGRTFQLYMTPARLTALQAYQNTVATFTDWDSTPDARSALLTFAGAAQWATPTYGETDHRVLVEMELVSQ